MTDRDAPLRDIADTALWVAAYRAQESARPDAVFRDPHAQALAGERGTRIVAGLGAAARRHSWALIARTHALDGFVADEVRAGADLVVNLAAGLDTRPYRMDLPASLRWVEVDLPKTFDYKESVLGDARPRCRLERVRLDLSDVPARRALLARLGGECRRALVITEGLLVYLDAEAVRALARDLAGVSTFARWTLDMVSPGLLNMMMKEMGAQLNAAASPFKFAPPEGPAFFAPLGWTPVSVLSNLKTGAKIGRLPFFLKLVSYLPDSNGAQGSRPWAGNCLFGRADAA